MTLVVYRDHLGCFHPVIHTTFLFFFFLFCCKSVFFLGGGVKKAMS